MSRPSIVTPHRRVVDGSRRTAASKVQTSSAVRRSHPQPHLGDRVPSDPQSMGLSTRHAGLHKFPLLPTHIPTAGPGNFLRRPPQQGL